MSDRKSIGVEPPSGTVQPNPGDSAVPAQPRKQPMRTSKSKTNDAQLEKKAEEERQSRPERETSSGFDASNKKPDDAKKSVGGDGGGGGGGCGSSGGKTPLIQVTRASCSISPETVLPEALEPSAHTKDQPHAGRVEDKTAQSAEKDHGAVSETATEAPRRGSSSSSSASLQRHHHRQQQQQQQLAHPKFPGVLIVVIASLLVVLGLVFVAVRFMVLGFCLVIFGTLLVLCGSLYLIHCCLETLRTKRQENFRAMALGRGGAWLTKPPPLNRRSMNRLAKRRSSGAISNASDEKVEAIEDLNLTGNEPLLRENDTTNVTRAAVAMPTGVATLKSAKTSTS